MHLQHLSRFLFIPQMLIAMVSGQTLRGSSSALSESQVRSTQGDSFVQNIMNDMSTHFGLGENYNPNFVSELQTCMAKWEIIDSSDGSDPSLERAADEQWRGIVAYYKDSTAQDPWVNCLDEPTHIRCSSSSYKEGELDMAAMFGDGTAREMVVEEPCNYASNIAYYHGALRICNREEWSGDVHTRNALKQSFVILAGGSAFFHASETQLGNLFDNLPISAIAYISYESLVDAIGGSSELRCLGVTNCRSSTDVARRLVSVSLDHSLSLDDENKTEWQNELESIQESFPHTYHHTFAATIAITAYICFPEVVAKEIVDSLASTFGLEDFVNKEVLPEAIPLIKGLGISDWQKPELIGKFIGSIAKISYAFLFQEVQVVDRDFNPTELAFGVLGAEKINEFGDYLSGNDQTAFPLAAGVGAYPGHEQCNIGSAHALWHQQSAEGLSELNFFVDSVIIVIESQCPNAGSLEGCPDGKYCKWSGTNNKCVAKKGAGQSCSKDLVCESNGCSGLSRCNQCPAAGSLGGCPSGQYCKWSGTNNLCVAKKGTGQSCSKDLVCESTHCSELSRCNQCPTAGSRDGCISGQYCKWSGTNNLCVVKKGTGQSCSKDLVCESNDCSRLSRCNQCHTAGSRDGCPSGQYCKWSGTNNKCVGLKPRRGTCSSGTVCQSRRCRFGFCTRP